MYRKFRASLIIIIITVFLCVGCNEAVTGDYTFPEIFDVSADKQTVSVGNEMTVSFYITRGSVGDFEVWNYLKVDQDTHNLIYKDNTADIEKSLVYFIVGIDEKDMKQVVKDGHIQYMIPYPYGNSEYTEKDVTKVAEYIDYHFDDKTRVVTLKFIVPDGAKTGYMKIDYVASYGVGFYPYKITVTEN